MWRAVRTPASSSAAVAADGAGPSIPRLAGLRCISNRGAQGRRGLATARRATNGEEPQNSSKQKPSVLDGLLDGMMAGRKMRRWYGASDEPMLPTRPAQEEQNQDQPPAAAPAFAAAAAAENDDENEDGAEDQTPRTAVLVTGADSPTGELVVLQLLLAGASEGGIRAVVQDVAAAKTAYAEYVEPVQAPSGGSLPSGPAAALAARRLLKGVAAVAVAGPLPPSLLEACAATNAGGKKGVRRLVVLSTVGAARPRGVFGGGLFSGEGPGGGAADLVLADGAREEAARGAVAGGAVGSVAVVRAAGGVRDAPGTGFAGLSLSVGGGGGNGGGAGVSGPVSREDLALVAARLCVEAAAEDGSRLDGGVLEVVVRPQAGAGAGLAAAAV